MSDRDYTDADKAKLKECYSLAERFEMNDTAKEVISARSGALRVSLDHLDDYAETSFDDTEMVIFSEIMEGLSMEPLDSRADTGQNGRVYALDKMPEGGEQEYIRALLALRYGRGNQQRMNALNHLSVALSYDPNDPRYIALLDILSSVGAR